MGKVAQVPQRLEAKILGATGDLSPSPESVLQIPEECPGSQPWVRPLRTVGQEPAPARSWPPCIHCPAGGGPGWEASQGLGPTTAPTH